jgi:hypothetical protein
MDNTSPSLGARPSLPGLLRETVAVSWASFPAFLAVCMVADLPFFVANSIWARSSITRYVGWSLLAVTARCFRLGIAMNGVAQSLRQRRVPVGESLRVGVAEALRARGAVAALALILGVGFTGTLMASMFFLREMSLSPYLTYGRQAIAYGTSMALLTVFGLAVPVAVAEKAPMGESLRRSAHLTRGRRGRIFLLLAIFLTVDLAVYNLLSRVGLGELELRLALVLISASTLAFLPLQYFHLREEEQRQTRDVAGVFE